MTGGATAVLTALVLLAMLATTPARIGPGWVTLWFVALLGALAGCLGLGIFGAKRLILRHEESPRRRWSASLRQGFLMAGCLTIFAAMQSLRQLSIRDVVLVLILAVLAEIYFRTRAHD